MSEGHESLPTFTNSPLVEVSLTAQFRPLRAFRNVHTALLWTHFREAFPRIEEHHPMPHQEEVFGPGRIGKLMVNLEVSDTPALPRTWFLNENGTELIQVQSDRFSRNWRRTGEGVTGQSEYPRYHHMRRRFEEDLVRFRDFVTAEHLGELSFDQCETSYVDEIDRPHRELPDVVRFWTPSPDGFLPNPEHVEFTVRYVIPDHTGAPLGRLYVEARPVIRKPEMKEVILLIFTARGRPDGAGIDGVLRFLDIGHEWGVRAFLALSSAKMQIAWGREDAR